MQRRTAPFVLPVSGGRGALPVSKKGRLKRILKRGLARGKAVVSRGGSDQRPAEEVTVVFEGPNGEELGTVVSAGGRTVLAAARDAGIDLDHFCGGQCSCGTCKVVVRADAQALTRPLGNEQVVLGQAGMKAGARLACQARLIGDVRVQIPRWF